MQNTLTYEILEKKVTFPEASMKESEKSLFLMARIDATDIIDDGSDYEDGTFKVVVDLHDKGDIK